MTPKVMDVNIHWKRILDEQLSFLTEGTDASKAGVLIMSGGVDERDTMLKSLVQQAAAP